jgi:hypothetical protein
VCGRGGVAAGGRKALAEESVTAIDQMRSVVALL